MARRKRLKAAETLTLPRFADRLYARLGRFGEVSSGVTTHPEPLWTGESDMARQLARGEIALAGATAPMQENSPWLTPAPSAAWSDALHGFEWLDHAAAAAEDDTRDILISWTYEWIVRYARGRGPGWRADLTGRRLARWVCHAPMIQEAGSREGTREFYRMIGRQTWFLRKRWHAAPEGLPRLQAIVGMIFGGLAVQGARGKLAAAAATLLSQEADRIIAADGGVPSRSPEELTEIFALFVWVADTLRDVGLKPGQGHRSALSRLAPAVRALRLGGGSMARFHGGGGGDPEHIDMALALSGLRPPARRVTEVMGFQRAVAARTTVILDAGDPDPTDETARRHASALCFEASIGRRPVIVSCGPGRGFGDDWILAARATAAHSGLTVDGKSSARLASRGKGPARLTGGVKNVSCDRHEDSAGVRLIASHDGYLDSHGLIHQRRLSLSANGGDLRGEDHLSATNEAARARFDRVAARREGGAIPYAIRFHLHPDVAAEVFLSGAAVRLKPLSGDLWVMRQSGGELTIEDSVWLDDRTMRTRATKQIVVRAFAKEYAGVVKWAFRRAEPDKPAPRDLAEAAAPG